MSESFLVGANQKIKDLEIPGRIHNLDKKMSLFSKKLVEKPLTYEEGLENPKMSTCPPLLHYQSLYYLYTQYLY